MAEMIINSDSYIAIRIDSIKDNEIINFNLYTLEQDRYFLFCNAFSSVKMKDLSQTYLKTKKFFYIKKDDRLIYAQHVEKHLAEILSNNNVSTEAKVDIVYEISNLMADQVFTKKIPLSESRVKNFASESINFIFSEQNSLRQIIKISDVDLYTYSHSLHVMIYMVSFFSFMGETNQSVLQRIATGSFLHDIGKSKIDKKIIAKQGDLSVLEWEEMKRHTIYGLEIIKNEMSIQDPMIESLITNHHERIDGSGYPHKKKELSIYEKAIGIIDTFDAMTSERSYQHAFKPFDAIEFLIKNKKEKFDLKLLQLFTLMLGNK